MVDYSKFDRVVSEIDDQEEQGFKWEKRREQEELWFPFLPAAPSSGDEQPDASLTLVCFHWLGGSAMGMKESLEQCGVKLPVGVRVACVQLAGHEHRAQEVFESDFEATARQLVPALAHLTRHGAPWAVLALGMGTWVAAAVLREVWRRHQRAAPGRPVSTGPDSVACPGLPAHVFLASFPAPGVPPTPACIAMALRHAAEPEKADEALNMLLCVWGADVDGLMGSARWPAYRRVILGDLRLLGSPLAARGGGGGDPDGAPGPGMPVRLTLARAKGDRVVRAADMLGWMAEFAAGDANVLEVSGTHFFPLLPKEEGGMRTLMEHVGHTLTRLAAAPADQAGVATGVATGGLTEGHHTADGMRAPGMGGDASTGGSDVGVTSAGAGAGASVQELNIAAVQKHCDDDEDDDELPDVDDLPPLV